MNKRIKFSTRAFGEARGKLRNNETVEPGIIQKLIKNLYHEDCSTRQKIECFQIFSEHARLGGKLSKEFLDGLTPFLLESDLNVVGNVLRIYWMNFSNNSSLYDDEYMIAIEDVIFKSEYDEETYNITLATLLVFTKGKFRISTEFKNEIDKMMEDPEIQPSTRILCLRLYVQNIQREGINSYSYVSPNAVDNEEDLQNKSDFLEEFKNRLYIYSTSDDHPLKKEALIILKNLAKKGINPDVNTGMEFEDSLANEKDPEILVLMLEVLYEGEKNGSQRDISCVQKILKNYSKFKEASLPIALGFALELLAGFGDNREMQGVSETIQTLFRILADGKTSKTVSPLIKELIAAILSKLDEDIAQQELNSFLDKIQKDDELICFLSKYRIILNPEFLGQNATLETVISQLNLFESVDESNLKKFGDLVKFLITTAKRLDQQELPITQKIYYQSIVLLTNAAGTKDSTAIALIGEILAHLKQEFGTQVPLHFLDSLNKIYSSLTTEIKKLLFEIVEGKMRNILFNGTKQQVTSQIDEFMNFANEIKDPKIKAVVAISIIKALFTFEIADFEIPESLSRREFFRKAMTESPTNKELQDSVLLYYRNRRVFSEVKCKLSEEEIKCFSDLISNNSNYPSKELLAKVFTESIQHINDITQVQSDLLVKIFLAKVIDVTLFIPLVLKAKLRLTEQNLKDLVQRINTLKVEEQPCYLDLLAKLFDQNRNESFNFEIIVLALRQESYQNARNEMRTIFHSFLTHILRKINHKLLEFIQIQAKLDIGSVLSIIRVLSEGTDNINESLKILIENISSNSTEKKIDFLSQLFQFLSINYKRVDKDVVSKIIEMKFYPKFEDSRIQYYIDFLTQIDLLDYKFLLDNLPEKENQFKFLKKVNPIIRNPTLLKDEELLKLLKIATYESEMFEKYYEFLLRRRSQIDIGLIIDQLSKGFNETLWTRLLDVLDSLYSRINSEQFTKLSNILTEILKGSQKISQTIQENITKILLSRKDLMKDKDYDVVLNVMEMNLEANLNKYIDIIRENHRFNENIFKKISDLLLKSIKEKDKKLIETLFGLILHNGDKLSSLGLIIDTISIQDELVAYQQILQAKEIILKNTSKLMEEDFKKLFFECNDKAFFLQAIIKTEKLQMNPERESKLLDLAIEEKMILAISAIAKHCKITNELIKRLNPLIHKLDSKLIFSEPYFNLIVSTKSDSIKAWFEGLKDSTKIKEILSLLSLSFTRGTLTTESWFGLLISLSTNESILDELLSYLRPIWSEEYANNIGKKDLSILYIAAKCDQEEFCVKNFKEIHVEAELEGRDLEMIDKIPQSIGEDDIKKIEFVFNSLGIRNKIKVLSKVHDNKLWQKLIPHLQAVQISENNKLLSSLIKLCEHAVENKFNLANLNDIPVKTIVLLLNQSKIELNEGFEKLIKSLSDEQQILLSSEIEKHEDLPKWLVVICNMKESNISARLFAKLQKLIGDDKIDQTQLLQVLFKIDQTMCTSLNKLWEELAKVAKEYQPNLIDSLKSSSELYFKIRNQLAPVNMNKIVTHFSTGQYNQDACLMLYSAAKSRELPFLETFVLLSTIYKKDKSLLDIITDIIPLLSIPQKAFSSKQIESLLEIFNALIENYPYKIVPFLKTFIEKVEKTDEKFNEALDRAILKYPYLAQEFSELGLSTFKALVNREKLDDNIFKLAKFVDIAQLDDDTKTEFVDKGLQSPEKLKDLMNIHEEVNTIVEEKVGKQLKNYPPEVVEYFKARTRSFGMISQDEGRGVRKIEDPEEFQKIMDEIKNMETASSRMKEILKFEHSEDNAAKVIRQTLKRYDSEKYGYELRGMLKDQPLSVLLDSGILNHISSESKLKSDVTEIILEHFEKSSRDQRAFEFLEQVLKCYWKKSFTLLTEENIIEFVESVIPKEDEESIEVPLSLINLLLDQEDISEEKSLSRSIFITLFTNKKIVKQADTNSKSMLEKLDSRLRLIIIMSLIEDSSDFDSHLIQIFLKSFADLEIMKEEQVKRLPKIIVNILRSQLGEEIILELFEVLQRLSDKNARMQHYQSDSVSGLIEYLVSRFEKCSDLPELNSEVVEAMIELYLKQTSLTVLEDLLKILLKKQKNLASILPKLFGWLAIDKMRNQALDIFFEYYELQDSEETLRTQIIEELFKYLGDIEVKEKIEADSIKKILNWLSESASQLSNAPTENLLGVLKIILNVLHNNVENEELAQSILKFIKALYSIDDFKSKISSIVIQNLTDLLDKLPQDHVKLEFLKFILELASSTTSEEDLRFVLNSIEKINWNETHEKTIPEIIDFISSIIDSAVIDSCEVILYLSRTCPQLITLSQSLDKIQKKIFAKLETSTKENEILSICKVLLFLAQSGMKLDENILDYCLHHYEKLQNESLLQIIQSFVQIQPALASKGTLNYVYGEFRKNQSRLYLALLDKIFDGIGILQGEILTGLYNFGGSCNETYSADWVISVLVRQLNIGNKFGLMQENPKIKLIKKKITVLDNDRLLEELLTTYSCLLENCSFEKSIEFICGLAEKDILSGCQELFKDACGEIFGEIAEKVKVMIQSKNLSQFDSCFQKLIESIDAYEDLTIIQDILVSELKSLKDYSPAQVWLCAHLKKCKRSNNSFRVWLKKMDKNLNTSISNKTLDESYLSDKNSESSSPDPKNQQPLLESTVTTHSSEEEKVEISEKSQDPISEETRAQEIEDTNSADPTDSKSEKQLLGDPKPMFPHENVNLTNQIWGDRGQGIAIAQSTVYTKRDETLTLNESSDKIAENNLPSENHLHPESKVNKMNETSSFCIVDQNGDGPNEDTGNKQLLKSENNTSEANYRDTNEQ